MSIEKPLVIRADAATVLAGMRRALGDLLSYIPGENRRPTDLQRTLGVDYKLCWQIINITRTDDPLAVSQYVPGSVSIKRLLAAAATHDVPENVLSDVDHSMKEFLRLVNTHSGDRQQFDSMLASISGGDGAETLTLQCRRTAFRSESQIWGVQVETYLRQMIVCRSAGKRGLDSCFVNAKYGLRRLRAEVTPIVHGYRDLAITAQGLERLEPLELEAAESFGAPVLAAYCSQPIPRFHTIQHSDGWIYSALNSEQIGRKSTVNLVFAGVGRNMPAEPDENGKPSARCGAAFIAPTELGVVELLVHRKSFGDVSPRFQLFATGAGNDVPGAMRRTQQFRIHEKLMSMGSAEQVATVPEVPRYRAQLQYVLKRLGWEASEFDVFRIRLAYPILHTTVRIVFADTNYSPPATYDI